MLESVSNLVWMSWNSFRNVSHALCMFEFFMLLLFLANDGIKIFEYHSFTEDHATLILIADPTRPFIGVIPRFVRILCRK